MPLRQANRRHDRALIGRDEPPDPIEVVSASGSHVCDARGRTFLDFTMGWCVGNLGWNRPEITARLAAFRGPDYVAPRSQYAPWLELASKLVAVVPGKLRRCFRVTTGTEAVECAMQIARAYTGRDKLVAIADDYHGNSIAVKHAISRTIPIPLDKRALARLERALEGHKVAAVIMEPIITNLGVELPSPEFVEGAAALCKAHGTLLVLDEVATGFGRTGRMFATSHFEVEPDLVCLAKSITNGAAPLAATLATAEVADSVAGNLEFYATFGWMPRSCEAALAVLDIWAREGEAILANVAAMNARVISQLTLPEGCAMRATGLAIGIDLPEGVDAEVIVARARRKGLLISGEEGQLELFPALTIDPATLDEGLAILGEVMGRA